MTQRNAQNNTRQVSLVRRAWEAIAQQAATLSTKEEEVGASWKEVGASWEWR